MLLEREAELVRAQALLEAAAAGRGQMLVLEGEAGIGKTALLRETVTRAGERGLRVLRARGGELEREFGYGVVRQLFEPAVLRADAAQQSRMLAGAAARAGALLHVGDALPVPVAPGEDPTFALLHALYWLTDNLAQDSPLLLAIDDAQWADLPSLRFLDHLARRLDGMPVGVVATWRSGEPGSPAGMLEGLRREPAVEALPLRPLSFDGARSLIHEHLGEADESFCAACHDTTTGNPFLLEELLRAVARGQLEPTVDAARRVGELGAGAIARGIFLRLSQLAPAATRLARAVAVLDVDGDLHRAGELAGVRGQELYETAAALQRANILASDEPLRFVHPILRSGVYGDLTSAEREALHRAAADLLHAAEEPDRAAAHLLLTLPAGDQAAVERLRDAARRARSQGATESAVKLLERALAEPATDLRLPVLLELAAAQGACGLPNDATVEQARRLATEPWQLLALSIVHGFDLGQRQQLAKAVEVLDTGVEAARSLGRAAQLQVEAFRASLAISTVSQATEAGERLARLAADFTEDTLEERHVLIALAYERVIRMHGTAAEVEALARRAAGDDGFSRKGLMSWSPSWAMFTLGMSGQVADSHALSERVLAGYTRRGHAIGVAHALGWQANLAWLRGDVEEAEQLLADSFNVVDDARYPFGRPWRRWIQVECRLARGDADGAERLLAEAGYATGYQDEEAINSLMLVSVRARLRALKGRRDQALEDLDLLEDMVRRRGNVHLFMVGEVPLTLAAVGRRDAALELAGANADLARRWGVPATTGAALRVLGTLTGGPSGLDQLREAVEQLSGSYAKLELATALVEYGAALRRANERQAAREPLRRGGELAQRCGATSLSERARQELEVTGARPRSLVLSGVESLTASERRVASMAASGLTNTEIAQALYVTRKTVETHLRHVFQKLDVSSRRDLPAALAGAGGERRTLLLARGAGDAARRARRDGLAHKHAARHGGRVVSADAEAVTLAFESPAAASACAQAIAAELPGIEVALSP